MEMMEDLRQTAMGYYKSATDEIRLVVQEFYNEMDPKGNGYVSFKKFSAYMETVGCKNMSSEEFYDELKQSGNEGLYFDDIITLFYIINSKRPFCGGKCKKFVKGMYFTCVTCFDFDHEDEGGSSYFSVCSQCFADQSFEHRHDEFLDPIVLLHLKKMEAMSKQTKYEHSAPDTKMVLMTTSDAHSDKQRTTSNSTSNAIVPAGNKKSEKGKIQTAIQLGQLVASLGSMVVASQLCTIM